MPRPALKTSIPYFVRDGAVHFRMSGTLTSLEDPDGRVVQLLELLDGERDINGVIRDYLDRWPDATTAEVRAAIHDLDETKLLQDASDTGDDFTASEKERWSNNFGFFETYASLTTSKYDFQRRIRSAPVAVLGVGGIGSHVLIDLVAIGFTDIRIVDFDSIELSNLNRQILYDELHIGQQKVDVAAERARSLNSGVHLDAVRAKIGSADDVFQMVADRDVVISVIDRPKVHASHWLNEGCVRAGSALIAGGVDPQKALYYTIIPGVSGCVECWYRQVRDNDPTSRMVLDVLDEIDDTGQTFGEDTAAFNGLVTADACLMVNEMVRLTSGVTAPLSIGQMIGMTFHNLGMEVIESWQRDPDCPTCRTAVPRPGLTKLLGSADAPQF